VLANYLIQNLAPAAGADGFPVFPNVAGAVGLGIAGIAGGLDVEDFNGDKLLDVFATGWGIADPARSFMADGRGGYDERTPQAGAQASWAG